jgi:hypothetical protein
MKLLSSIWDLLLLLGILGVPQLLGVLAYLRLRKYQAFLAHVLSFLIPPIIFFYFARMIFVSEAQHIQSQGGRVCGGFAGVAIITILLGTAAQIFFSILVQLVLHFRHQTNSSS